MKCGQGKPFTVTSSNSKMGGAAIKSYEKGGIVVKVVEESDDDSNEVYTAKMGKPPKNPDMMTSLTPAQRKTAEARMKSTQGKKK
jgi:hypothetical protein